VLGEGNRGQGDIKNCVFDNKSSACCETNVVWDGGKVSHLHRRGWWRC